ncbi:MAG: AAA family ATPase [Cyanobacteria bacterium P01_G01_bin.54]
MMTLLGYEDLHLIHDGVNSQVYRACRIEDGQSVILKFLNRDYPTSEQIRRYKQEYYLTFKSDTPGIIKAYCLERCQRSYVIVFEDFGGFSLKQWLQEQEEIELQAFFSIAIAITKSLKQVHARNIIHKDINPENIVINPKTQELKIIDFGISTQLNRENTTLKNPNILEGTLAYISPEQTGRMNRGLDYRTDFYSLGVTFYELLTNTLPFQTDDALEIVHWHTAKTPSALTQDQIPSMLNNIVMKLMAKNAEERYQSAEGLQADLEQCRQQLEQTGNIAPFPLAQQDISAHFQTSQRLYGRETETVALLEAFERVAETGTVELILVAGYSGIGKSSLVQELYQPITAHRGYFIAGKFEQFQRNIPYSALVAALGGLVGQLLGESEAQLHVWREKLLSVLGKNGQIIIDVIPEVELIIGKQPPVPVVGTYEAQNRFNLVFGSFIHVFCGKEHPLTLFLDDLQWADSATLKLIDQLLIEGKINYLLLLGAYRNNEVSAVYPLSIFLAKLRQSKGVSIGQIVLKPLPLAQIKILVSDTLQQTQQTPDLAQLIWEKTRGNPFFINKFLQALYDEGLLEFDRQMRTWQWDLEVIAARDFTDNVVDLMVKNLKKLPSSSQEVLSLAAHLGVKFDLKILAWIASRSMLETFEILKIALSKGLIIALSELDEDLLIQSYKFGHDRIQQAAFYLIGKKQRRGIHLQMARTLCQKLSVEEQRLHLFAIVNHYNVAIDKITDIAERHQLLDFNIAAGKKAKDSAAYEVALQYYQTALALLPSDSWQRNYTETLKLYEANTEAAYLTGNFAQMDAFVEIVLNHAVGVLDRVKTYDVKIQALIAQGRQLDGLDTAQDVLTLLGIEIPDAPQPEDLQAEFAAIAQAMGGKSVADLVTLPLMTDAQQLAIVNILNNVLPSCYQAKPSLFPLFVCKQMQLLIRYGNMSYSSHICACYGIVCILILKDIALAQQYAAIACQLDLSPETGNGVRGTYVAGGSLLHYSTHLKETLPLFLDAYQAGLETGDFQFGGFAVYSRLQNLYFIGSRLANLKQDAIAASEALITLNQENTLAWIQLWTQTILNLLGESARPWELVGTAYDENQEIPLEKAAGDRTCLYLIYFNKLMLCYLFERFSQAVKNAALAESYLDGIVGTVNGYLWNFYDSLIQLAYYNQAEDAIRTEILAKVKRNQAVMQNWVTYAPMNSQHKYDLVAAEWHRVLGEKLEAIECYTQAIVLAKANEYIQEEALANELAAKFYLDWGQEKIAGLYMKEAHYCYTRWGAIAKVQHLEATYPQLLRSPTQPTASSDSPHRAHPTAATTAHSSSHLDIATLIKASQSITSEIVLSQLLTQLMRVLLENAGAQAGCLILATAGELRIEAAVTEKGAIEVLQALPLDGVKPDDHIPLLSAAIVNYVARTHECVVLNDACREGPFTNQAYLQNCQVKSVLCVPLVNRGQLRGVVYLENNLALGAFTADRVELVQLLSGQAAISLENARFYQTLEGKVAERTEQLAAANHEITQLNARLKAENLRMGAELDVAQQVQEMILPRPAELSAIPELDIAGYMTAAAEVGGDYYDVLVEEDWVTMGIGDVTGHGLESGLVMLMAQTTIRALQELQETDPVRFLNTVNATLYKNVQRMGIDRQMTLALLTYNRTNGQLNIAGQHEDVLLVGAQGEVAQINTLDLGMTLALLDDIAEFIAEITVELQPEQGVVLYTDGIPEAKNGQGEYYGLERLTQVVQDHWSQSAQGVIEGAIADIQAFLGQAPVKDDITLLVLKRR